jgi:hypothetical protein
MKSRFIIFCSAIALFSAMAISQTADAYADNQTTANAVKGLLDPSRFSIHHALSFGMASGSDDKSVKSQSVYTSMLQYKFAEPLTLNLNFSMPLYSSFNSAQNLTSENINSMAYFQNMPFDASLTWKPTNNLMMHFSVMRDPQSLYSSFMPMSRMPYLLPDW